MGSLHEGKRRNTLVHWPIHVDKRLDLLRALIGAHGSQASRAQLLAALVATAPLDGAELERTVRAYIAQDEASFIAEHSRHPPPPGSRHRPGPRSHRTRSDQADTG